MFHLFARALCLVGGLLLLSSSLFLYESERGRVQNRLEEFWIKVDDLAARALSRELAFLQAVVEFTASWFDRLLGKRLFSVQSISVSACFSVGSTFITLALVSQWGLGNAVEVFIGASLFVLGTIPAIFMDSSSSRRAASMLILIWVAIEFGFAASHKPPISFYSEAVQIAGMEAAMIIGILCDFLVVGCNRLALRRIAHFNNVWGIVGLLFLNLLLAAVVVSPVLLPFGRRWLPEAVRRGGILVASANAITVIASLAVVFLMLAALINRVVWPLVSRPIYAAAQHGLIRRQKLLGIFGVFLIAYGVQGSVPSWTDLREFFK